MRFTIASVALLTLVSAAPFEDFLTKVAGGKLAHNAKRQSGECNNPLYTVCPGLDFCAEPGSICCTDGSGFCDQGTLCKPNTMICCRPGAVNCGDGEDGPTAPPLSGGSGGTNGSGGSGGSGGPVGWTTPISSDRPVFPSIPSIAGPSFTSATGVGFSLGQDQDHNPTPVTNVITPTTTANSGGAGAGISPNSPNSPNNNNNGGNQAPPTTPQSAGYITTVPVLAVLGAVGSALFI